LFGNLEWRATTSLVINAGAMAERDSVSGDTLSPRLMANWHMTEGQTWRLGVSKAVRPPSTYENSANVRYNWIDPIKPFGFNRSIDQTFVHSTGNLLPEVVLSREVGYLGDFPKLGLNLDVRLFHEQISQFIRHITYYTAQPSDYANNESFAIRGLEYQLKWAPWQGGQFVLNQAYTRIDSIDPGTALAAPRLASSLAWSQKLPGRLDLTLMHTDNRQATLAGASVNSAVAMTRTDLRLAKGLRWGTHRGEIALVLQNLGTAYADYRSNFLFQRQAFVTLRLED
jgi:iron complex outermembrane receptor protein